MTQTLGKTNRENFGYMLAKLETISDMQTEMRKDVKDHMDEEEKLRKEQSEAINNRFDEMEECMKGGFKFSNTRIETLEDSFKSYRTIAKTLKGAALFGIAILSATNWDSVKELWTAFISSGGR